MKVNLKTPNLIIEDIKLKNAQDMYKNWGCDERVSRWMLWKTNNNLDEVKNIIKIWEKNNLEDNYCQLVLMEKSTQEAIGTITCCINNKHKYCDLAFCLGVNWWGKSLMSEALTCVMKFLNENYKIHRFQCEVLTKNDKCCNMLKKCDFNLEGCAKQKYFTKNNKWEDVFLYSKLF